MAIVFEVFHLGSRINGTSLPQFFQEYLEVSFYQAVWRRSLLREYHPQCGYLRMYSTPQALRS